MAIDKLNLTPTDYNAIDFFDSNHLNNKGASHYSQGDYGVSVEYYRLAAAMGNVHSISNLGYCYLYGREVDANLSLAIAYFKIASHLNDVDATYKLGDIYGSDKWGVKDTELSVYFYRMAASFILGEAWENNYNILFNEELEKYPSLCFALGRELSDGGSMNTDLDAAFQFLIKAELGYKRELMNGNTMYEKSYNNVLMLLSAPQFDDIRDKYDDIDEDDEF